VTTTVEGVCRYCGCTEADPCWACRESAGEARWKDLARTVCTAPACFKAEEARIRALRKARPKKRFSGWGYGAAVIQLRRETRRRSQRKRRVS